MSLHRSSFTIGSRILRLTTNTKSLPSCIQFQQQRYLRTHHSANVPTDTPRIQLDDGSVFIHRFHPESDLPLNSTQLPPQINKNQVIPEKLSESPSGASEHLKATQDMVEEMRRLRHQDPDYYTVSVLAKKFNVSKLFVLNAVPAPKERKAKVQRDDERYWESLSVVKKVRVLNRIKRKEMW